MGSSLPVRPRAARLTLAALATMALVGCSMSVSGQHSTTQASLTATPTSAPQRELMLFYPGNADSACAGRLFSESRTAPTANNTLDQVMNSLTHVEPLDPDYTNPWLGVSGSLASTSPSKEGGTVATLAFASERTDSAIQDALTPIALQQIAHTTTSALSADNTKISDVDVTFTFTGEDAPSTLSVRPLAAKQVRAPVWITEPRTGQQLSAGVIDFFGDATSPNGVVRYIVTQGSTEIAQGTADVGSGADYDTYRFDIALGPGDYTVRVFQDQADTELNGCIGDSKTFTVIGT